MTIEPCDIRVPEEVLADLRARLAHTRWPDPIEGSDWDHGTDGAYLRGLCEYWRDGFDWRAQEAALRRFEHLRTRIDGQPLHFVHARSPRRDALPLLMTHGWPGSVSEFTKVLGPLSDPESHGGDGADAFHVVCPSLPGFAWSAPLRETGWDARRVADAWAELMSRLGYERFGTQGGDWGAIVGVHLAEQHPERHAGAHFNMVVPAPPPGAADPMAGLSPEETRDVAGFAAFQQSEMGYFQIQSTKPQTLGFGLNDSPAGLAAWIVEKFRTWSDCDGEVEKRFSRDELLTNVTLYWATGTIDSSLRIYRESARSGALGIPKERIRVPSGFAIFPKEVFRTPRSWVEARFDVRRWTQMPAGGHFAALEEPERLVEDLRAFYRELR